MNVLVSEADTTTLYTLKRVLGRAGCGVVEASNGLDMLDKLQHQRIDLVMLDLQMPVMGGLETLGILRELTEYAHLPTVVFSTDSDETIVHQCIALGVRDFILK